MDKTVVHYQKLIPYNNVNIEEEEEKDLEKILSDIRILNEINGELSILLNEQGENLDQIVTTQENIEETTEKTIEILEKAVSHKIKFVPIAIGMIVGAGILGPGALLLGVKAGAGYIAVGGSVVGGIVGKKIS